MAAGDEVSVKTLQRALNAMGRALVLHVREREISYDETLIRANLARPPAARIDNFEQLRATGRSLAAAGAIARGAAGDGVHRPGALLAWLAASDVDFVVVGGLAAAAHGASQVTRAIDVAYARGRENQDRLRGVLMDLGARLRGVAEDVPFVPDGRALAQTRILTLDTRDGPLDLLAAPDGSPGYAVLSERALRIEWAGTTVKVASLQDLIAMKRAAGRPKDLLAVEELEAIQRILREEGGDG